MKKVIIVVVATITIIAAIIVGVAFATARKVDVKIISSTGECLKAKFYGGIIKVVETWETAVGTFDIIVDREIDGLFSDVE